MSNINNYLKSKSCWARFAGFRLDLNSHQLYRGAERIPLPARAGQVLGLLVRNHGVLVSRDQISDEIWGSRHIDFEASLNTAIRSIRRALNDEAANPSFVETAPRHGYRFLQVPEFSDTLPDTPKHPRLSTRQKSLVTATGILTTLLIAMAIFFLLPHNPTLENEGLAIQAYVESPGYKDYIRGCYAQSHGELDKAETHFEAALKVDPNLAPAYVGLARVNVRNRKLGWNKILTAQSLVDKSIAIDADLVAANILKAAMALYYWRDHALAKIHIEKALAIAPNDPDALVVNAHLNIIEGNANIALQSIAKAYQLHTQSATHYGWILYKAGNWNDAERMCKTSDELNGQSESTLDCIIHINHSQGDHAEAAEFGLQLMALRGAAELELDTVREMVDASAREAAYWEWTLDWLDANHTNISDALSRKGVTLTMLGRYDEAIEVFEHAFDQNGEPFLAFFAVDPRVDKLRTHESFTALAERSRLSLAQD